MRFLLFDVKPWHDTLEEYLSIAAALRPQLDESGGCDFIDRFRRIAKPGEAQGWILSFQFWRDEASLVRWRSNAIHHDAQQNARDSVFEDYRLRVGEVVYSEARDSTTNRSDDVNDTDTFVAMLETEASTLSLPLLSDPQSFESLYRPGRFLHIGVARSLTTMKSAIESARVSAKLTHIAIGRIERDYGMFERDQAPQIFAPRES
jgi:heme-degrading monooxygenase HmoA